MSDARNEDDYFTRLEFEKKQQLREELQAQQKKEDLDALKQLHHHRCGKCGNEMTTLPFRGIEIEICPSCGAVLLDPGELEMLSGQDNGGIITSFFETFFGAK